MYYKDLKEMLRNETARDWEFEDYVEQLITLRKLEHPASLGIAKQLVSEGARSLTDKQIEVFVNKGLDSDFYAEECRGGHDIPWSEMLDAADNGGWCGRCQWFEAK
ncbi:hypothetical protein [Oceanobacillus oncorhynchi]|uniref:hypothetical protein n=1 Tax=Oceanobacillus oncorhynchi TaxID=545501 RepID=UPI001866B2C8|nr:hypothetical protein [Oceanobacillus oncorhynchi]